MTKSSRIVIPRILSIRYVVSCVVTFLLAQGSAMYTLYSVGQTEGIRQSGGMLGDLPYTLIGFHTAISISLGVCFAALWWRTRWALIVSLAALLAVLATYGRWYYETAKYLKELETYPAIHTRVQRDMGLFHGATNWDFVVFVGVIVLLLWNFAIVRPLIRSDKAL